MFTGNLFNTTDKYIVHGCNAQRVMGSGVARVVRSLYPEAYELYMKSSMKMGSFSISGDEKSKHRIVNMITQDYYGTDGHKYVSYDAVDKGFKLLNSTLEAGTKVSIPKIGSDRGGGNWEVLKTIIDYATPNLHITVYKI